MINDLPLLFSQQGHYLSASASKKTTPPPFKEHWQLPLLVDIFSRKNHHHLLLQTDFSRAMVLAFFETFLLHLTQDTIPIVLRDAKLLYFDTFDWLSFADTDIDIEKELQLLRDHLDNSDSCLLIAIKQCDALFDDKHKRRTNALQRLLTHPKCRFIFFDARKDHFLRDHVTELTLSAPTESDIIALLKQERTELEYFHQVIIPDDVLTEAHLLAKRYLSTQNTFEKTLLLLDSSAARASVSEIDHRPTLSTATLSRVLSSWTQIPSSHLLFTPFKFADFVQTMQQRVFGQEAAITLLAEQLQQAEVNLQHRQGPLCSLLLAGPAHTGKKTLALALADQLFKQINLFYYVNMDALTQANETASSLLHIKLQRRTDKHYKTLQTVIQLTPYAIILFENIERASPAFFDDIQAILDTGFLYDTAGKSYDFRQTIFLFSTTLGTERLTKLIEASATEEESSESSLLQLVLSISDQKNPTHAFPAHYTTQELIEQVWADITTQLPTAFYQAITMAPFIPLSKSAIENIIRIKLKSLGKMLAAHHGIELGYASEVIRYIATIILNKNNPTGDQIDIEKALKQLYFIIEQSVSNQGEHQHESKQLFLKLNETGHSLRCDWLEVTARHHTA